MTDPRYIPLYTRANDLLLSATGTHLDRIVFMAGIATPWKRNKLNEFTSNDKNYAIYFLTSKRNTILQFHGKEITENYSFME